MAGLSFAESCPSKALDFAENREYGRFMMLPDLDEMRLAVASLCMTDAKIREELAALGHSVSLRAIWAFRNREGHPAWKTVQAFAALITKHHRIDEEANQSVENVNKSAA